MGILGIFWEIPELPLFPSPVEAGIEIPKEFPERGAGKRRELGRNGSRDPGNDPEVGKFPGKFRALTALGGDPGLPDVSEDRVPPLVGFQGILLLLGAAALLGEKTTWNRRDPGIPEALGLGWGIPRVRGQKSPGLGEKNHGI